VKSFERVDPRLIDYVLPKHDGYPAKLAVGDTPDVLRDVCGAASREFPKHLWIEPNLWAEKAKENDELHTWPMNYIDRYTNQSPTHECTCHSLSRAAEGARNRQRGILFPEGPKKGFRYEESEKFDSVWLSPLSVYSEANPQMWGGAGIRQVLEIAVRRGFLPETVQPKDYKFKHAIHGTTGAGGLNQASGRWIRVSNFPAGWQDTAKWFRPQEVIFPDSWEQAVCLVLHGYFVCVGRNGHAIPWGLWNPVSKVMAYPDSYDVTRYDSLSTVKRAWQGSFAIASMTTPDDWRFPAGGYDA
jgi:hypothetical protein